MSSLSRWVTFVRGLSRGTEGDPGAYDEAADFAPSEQDLLKPPAAVDLRALDREIEGRLARVRRARER